MSDDVTVDDGFDDTYDVEHEDAGGEPADITDLAHTRDGDGQLLPVDRTIDVRGEGEATVEIIPATSGQANEWRQRLDGAGEDIDGELRDELFDEFLPYEPADFGGAESWADIRPALEDALGTVVLSEIFDVDADAMDRALQEAMAEVEDGGGADEGN